MSPMPKTETTKKYTVCIEWPTGSEEIEMEVPLDASEHEVEEAAKDTFFNRCRYGVREGGIDE